MNRSELGNAHIFVADITPDKKKKPTDHEKNLYYVTQNAIRVLRRASLDTSKYYVWET